MTKILVLSDLHVDLFQKDPNFLVNPDSFDIAFVCGDIANNAKETLRYMKKFKEKVIHNKPMCFVAGNHDRWGKSFEDSESFLQQIPGYLNRQETEFQGQRILGCTLWYKPSAYATKNDWSDYHFIIDWENIRSEHAQDVAFLQDEMREGDIVITHMLPGIESVSSGYICDPYNSFYVTELGPLILERKPKLWVGGHSHDFMNKTIHETMYIRNPRGYRGENPKYKLLIVDTNKLGQYDCIEIIKNQ